MSRSPVDAAEEFLLQLGRAMWNWQVVEGATCALFTELLATRDEAHAKIVFTTISNFRNRLSVIDALIKHRLPEASEQDVRDEWKGLRQNIEDWYRERRNSLAHWSFLGANSEPGFGAQDFKLVPPLTDPRTTQRAYTVENLKQWEDDFIALSVKIFTFCQQVRTSLASQGKSASPAE